MDSKRLLVFVIATFLKTVPFHLQGHAANRICIAQLRLITPELKLLDSKTEMACPSHFVCSHANISYTEQMFLSSEENQVANPHNETFLYEQKDCLTPENCLQMCNRSYADEVVRSGFINCTRFCCSTDRCNENQTANTASSTSSTASSKLQLSTTNNLSNPTSIRTSSSLKFPIISSSSNATPIRISASPTSATYLIDSPSSESCVYTFTTHQTAVAAEKNTPKCKCDSSLQSKYCEKRLCDSPYPKKEEIQQTVEMTIGDMKNSEWTCKQHCKFKDAIAQAVNEYSTRNRIFCDLKRARRSRRSVEVPFTLDHVHLLPGYPKESVSALSIRFYIQIPPGYNVSVLPVHNLLEAAKLSKLKLESAIGKRILAATAIQPETTRSTSTSPKPRDPMSFFGEWIAAGVAMAAGVGIAITVVVIVYCKQVQIRAKIGTNNKIATASADDGNKLELQKDEGQARYDPSAFEEEE